VGKLVKDGFVKRELKPVDGEENSGFRFDLTDDFDQFGKAEDQNKLFDFENNLIDSALFEKVWGDKGGDSKVTMQLPLAPPPVALNEVIDTLRLQDYVSQL